MRIRWAVMVACGLWAASESAWSGGRMFLIPLNTPPGNAVPGSPYVVSLADPSAQDTITIGVYVDVDPDEEVKAAQATLPCGVLCSGGGNLQFQDGTAVSDCSRRDSLAFGYGLPHCGWILDPGNCDIPDYSPRVAIAMPGPPIGPPIPVMTGLRNIGSFQFRVSPDCLGTALLELPNEPQSAMRDENNWPIPFTTDGMLFDVPAGRCCSEGGCNEGINAIACREAHGPNAMFVPNATCDEPCCFAYSDCDDGNACTFQQCSNTVCDMRSTAFGDVDGSGGPANIDDVLCAIGGFGNINDCPTADIWPSCTGNGIVTGDDLFAVIQAFGGFDPCGCNP